MQLEFPVSTPANPSRAVPCESPILSGSGEGQHCEDLRSTRWTGYGPGSNRHVVEPACQRARCVSHSDDGGTLQNMGGLARSSFPLGQVSSPVSF